MVTTHELNMVQYTTLEIECSKSYLIEHIDEISKDREKEDQDRDSAIDEIVDELDPVIRPVFPFEFLQELAVFVDGRIGESRALVFRVPGMKQTVLIEPRIGDLHPLAATQV